MASQAVVLLMLKASIILSGFAIGLKATFADATFLHLSLLDQTPTREETS
jgi:hypothetical protein